MFKLQHMLTFYLQFSSNMSINHVHTVFVQNQQFLTNLKMCFTLLKYNMPNMYKIHYQHLKGNVQDKLPGT